MALAKYKCLNCNKEFEAGDWNCASGEAHTVESKRYYVLDAPMEHDTITLYRGPILLEWIETGEDLFRLIRNVLIQEIGHHFGLSEAELERIERGTRLAW